MSLGSELLSTGNENVRNECTGVLQWEEGLCGGREKRRGEERRGLPANSSSKFFHGSYYIAVARQDSEVEMLRKREWMMNDE